MNLRAKWRWFRLWTCRLRGHTIIPDSVAFAFYEPDRYVDGKIVRGESYEWMTVKCQECGK